MSIKWAVAGTSSDQLDCRKRTLAGLDTRHLRGRSGWPILTTARFGRPARLAAPRSIHPSTRSRIDQQLLHGSRSTPSVPRQRTPIDGLTPREQHVLRLLVDGCSTNEIVERMNVTPSTVRTHVQSIFVKMGVHSRLQAVALLSREGLLDRVGGFHDDLR